MLFRFQDVIDEIQDGDFHFFRGKAFYSRGNLHNREDVLI